MGWLQTILGLPPDGFTRDIIILLSVSYIVKNAIDVIRAKASERQMISAEGGGTIVRRSWFGVVWENVSMDCALGFCLYYFTATHAQLYSESISIFQAVIGYFIAGMLSFVLSIGVGILRGHGFKKTTTGKFWIWLGSLCDGAVLYFIALIYNGVVLLNSGAL